MSGSGSEPKVPRNRITPMERIQWARRVVALKADGKTWPEIAAETGMSQAKCKRLAKDLAVQGDPAEGYDPMDVIQRHLDVLETTMYEASQTYIAAPAGSSARVGALKLLRDSSREVIDYMRVVGLLPRHLGAVSADREMQQVFREFAEILRDHKVGDDVLMALLNLADRKLAPPVITAAPALPA